jgi:hypothetical protein
MSVHRVLEIDHAGIGLAHHEIARHVVAVHIHPRLRQRPPDNESGHFGQRLSLRRREFQPQMPADVPLGKQVALAAEQRLVVRRQHVVAARSLPLQQRLDRIAEQPVRVTGIEIERGEIGRVTKVREQQEPALQVLRHHFRRMHACRAQELRNPHERPAILARRRGVHGDPRAAFRRHAKVAAKAGVGRGRSQRVGGAETRREPAAQFIQAGVGARPRLVCHERGIVRF